MTTKDFTAHMAENAEPEPAPSRRHRAQAHDSGNKKQDQDKGKGAGKGSPKRLLPAQGRTAVACQGGEIVPSCGGHLARKGAHDALGDSVVQELGLTRGRYAHVTTEMPEGRGKRVGCICSGTA